MEHGICDNKASAHTVSGNAATADEASCQGPNLTAELLQRDLSLLRRLEEAPLPRSSPRYPAELSQFPDGLLHEAFRKLFRSHAAGGSVRRDNFINLA